MRIRKIRVEEAIGLPLAHDITEIIPGRYKGVAFRRGHIIQEGDLAKLKSLGKENVYILELSPQQIHEDEAAIRIARAVCAEGFLTTEPSEGKVNIKSQSSGLLKINRKLLYQINTLEGVILVTRHTDTFCRPDMTVAATRIIPLYTANSTIEAVERMCQGRENKIIHLLPLGPKRAGIIVTGNEIYRGIREDSSGDILRAKLEFYGSQVTGKILVPDDPTEIAKAIQGLVKEGNDLVLISGGMSVDPDDVTVEGVEKSQAEILFYGIPVLPGAMFLYALLDGVHILGIPACVIYHKVTALDLLLPKVLADEGLSRDYVANLSYGGLCLHCNNCHFPACPFGKV